MPEVYGPILILDAASADRLDLAALFVADSNEALAPISAPGGRVIPEPLARIADRQVWRARFSVPAQEPSEYSWNRADYQIAGLSSGDIRLAYASCNGEERGDLLRPEDERNVMWARLAGEHSTRPFSLLLHGGDQIYADEATDEHPLSADWPVHLPRDPGRAALLDLREHLRSRFLERYEAQFRSRDYAWLAARVPSLSQWDDHDICDGWGSLPRSRTYSPVGQTLFSVAREMALIFQHGTVDGDLPSRFSDPQGMHLGWTMETPTLRITAPDLRSERTRRQIMGPSGWADFLAATAGATDPPGQGKARPGRATGHPSAGTPTGPARTLLMSSVPVLGPRLSILEALMVAMPRMQKYEDDLRDQWQSRVHRAEWQRMLQHLDQVSGDTGTQIAVLSGEIHLATRATMQLGHGGVMHQLVASGVTHRPPPRLWARALGALSSLPETPLPNRPIRTRQIPGTRKRYIAERNVLTLSRDEGAWSARWIFEHSGATAPLAI